MRRWLRGEDLGEVSREVQVSPPELEEWRRVFPETGRARFVVEAELRRRYNSSRPTGYEWIRRYREAATGRRV